MFTDDVSTDSLFPYMGVICLKRRKQIDERGVEMKKIMVLIFVSLTFVFSCERPKEQKLPKEKLFELSERCSTAGRSYFENFSRETNAFAFSTKTRYTWDEPEYHYNSRLNTCLIHIRYIEFDKYDSAISHHYNQVVDIFSNKTILRGWFRRKVDDKNGTDETVTDMRDGIPNYTSVEYFKQKNKLFSE